MQNISFHFPTRIYLGKKVLARVGRVLSLAGHRRVVLVAGQGSIRGNGVYTAIVESLQKNDIFWTESWEVTPNPECSRVADAALRAKEFAAQALLAVGGGSVIDAAQACRRRCRGQGPPLGTGGSPGGYFGGFALLCGVHLSWRGNRSELFGRSQQSPIAEQAKC